VLGAGNSKGGDDVKISIVRDTAKSRGMKTGEDCLKEDLKAA
jgi:hypothetical protein